MALQNRRNEKAYWRTDENSSFSVQMIPASQELSAFRLKAATGLICDVSMFANVLWRAIIQG